MFENGLKGIYQITKQKYSDRFRGCKFHHLTSPDEEGSEEYYLAEHSSAKQGGFTIMKIQVAIKIEWYISMISQGIVIQFFLFNFLIIFTQNTEPNQGPWVFSWREPKADPRPGRTDRSGCPKSAAYGAPTTGGMGNCGRCEFLVRGWWMN